MGGVGRGCCVQYSIFNIQYSIGNQNCLSGVLGLPLVDKIDKLLEDKTYIVLLQNNTELRASGVYGLLCQTQVQSSNQKRGS